MLKQARVKSLVANSGAATFVMQPESEIDLRVEVKKMQKLKMVEIAYRIVC